mgnify:CR=1 FL=1|jgi:hypothetical protein
MAEKKAAQAVQQMSKAQQGVERARQQAERGELISRKGIRMNPASLANLRPCRTLDQLEPEEKRERQQSGGAASGESRRARRSLREICQAIADLPLSDKEALTDAGAQRIAEQTEQQTGKPCTIYEAMAAAQAVQAMAGNVKAFVAFRDSAGDKPAENVEIGGELSANSQALLDKLAAMNGLKVHEDGENNG